MAKLQDGTRIYGTANVDGNLNVNTSLSVGTSLAVNTYFTANASQVRISSPLSSNGSTGTAGQILVSGGANNAYWGSTTPLYNYSAQFNGSSYLTLSNNAMPATGAFTIECWFYTSISALQLIYTQYLSTDPNRWGFGIDNNTGYKLYFGGTYGATVVPLNQWNHIAVTRDASNTLRIFLNGVLDATTTSFTSSLGQNNPRISGWTVSGGGQQGICTGYISNLRIVSGTAVYTSAFTPPTSPLTAISGTTLLTCNALTLTDASPNALAITNNGPVVASATSYPTSFPQSAVYVPTTALTAIRQQFTGDGTTTQFNISGGYTPNTISVFVNGVLARNGSDVTVTSGSYITFTGITPPNGSLIDVTGTVPTTYSSITPVSYSTSFNGSSQYLTLASNAALAFGTGDFTIECWVNSSNWKTSTAAPIFISAVTGGMFFGTNGTNFVVRAYSVADQLATATLPALNTWTHVAAVRIGTTLSLYYNGALITSTTNSYNFLQGAVYIGNDAATAYYQGYISNLRITKGVGVYTGAFTPPQSPLQATQIYGGPTIQAITGTQTALLTCNAPTIVDGSTNAFAITNNGTATVSTAVVPTFTNIVMNSTSADAYNSSTGNLGMLFDNTNNRQMFTAYGFQFKNEGGIITPTNKTKVSFYNEAANTWTVPAGVTRIFVKMWGAGGGGGSYGGWRQGGLGGGGGFTHGLFNVVPGEVIQIRPGGKGWERPGSATAYPDGGGAATSGGSDNQYSSNGGGSSSIRIPSISATVYAMYAGGGGGGGAGISYTVSSGGAGGGLTGQPGTKASYFSTTTQGSGGTQTAGGAGGTGDWSTGGAGTAGQGGTHQSTYMYGAGGGGGYYGGGSGCHQSAAPSHMGAGGGGSGFVHSSALFGATYTGSYRVPAMSNDPDIQPTNTLQYAYGAEEACQGGPGVIVFYY